MLHYGRHIVATKGYDFSTLEVKNIDTQALTRASELSFGDEEIIRKLYAAAEGQGKDIEKFVSFFSEQGYMYDIPSGTKFRGRPLVTLLPPLLVHFLMSTVSY